MKRILLLTAAIALGSAAAAQQGQPGAHFVENWDFDEDGQVTLAEASERRSDIFTTFDENDDGFLSPEDYAMFDEARAADKEGLHGQSNRLGKGQGNGQGHGQGQGQTRSAEVGMQFEFNDTNNDGMVSRDEFQTRTADWFARMDRNGDGVITGDDFGRRS